MDKEIDIPPAWRALDLERLRGVVMVLGRPDAGKSTFCRYLFERLAPLRPPAAYLDGDPGQSTLGPPGTMTLGLAGDQNPYFPPRGRVWRSFVGFTSPRGHMLQVLVSAARLAAAARQAGAGVVIYDTTGLVSAAGGGINLKLAKIDLLRPDLILALQYEQELEVLLEPLRRCRRAPVWDLPPSPSARLLGQAVRRAHRAERFARYFAGYRRLAVDWEKMAVFPRPVFEPGRLVAMEDGEGFTLGLGIMVQIAAGKVLLRTPLASLEGVSALRLGDLEVDLNSFADRWLKPAW